MLEALPAPVSPPVPAEPVWWRKPGGSIHAVEAPAFRTACGRYTWTAAWSPDDGTDERCETCEALLTPTESELRALDGDR
jgi:hypothetical protein